MIHVANLSETDRRALFLNTAEKKNLHPAVVEKDFWVCYLLDHLFHRNQYQKSFVFKGGTSLSITSGRDMFYGSQRVYQNIRKPFNDGVNR